MKFNFSTTACLTIMLFSQAGNSQENCVYMASDIYPGSYGAAPNGYTEFNGAIYFAATGDMNGVELWKFENGVSSIVADINPGIAGSMPNSLTVVGAYLYFSASTGATGSELFRFDGTTVSLVSDINPGVNGSFPNTFMVTGSELYFVANNGLTGFEPWKCVGLIVTQVADINPGMNGSAPSEIVEFGGDIYYTAYTDANGEELWKYDGSVMTLFDLYPGATGSDIGELTAIPSHLCFRATDGVQGYELWTYDGSTLTNLNVNPSSDFTPWELTAVGSELLLRGFLSTSGYELWKFDGTSASLVMDIWPGSTNSTPNNLTAVNDVLYFAANTSANGNELWKYDGVSTVLAADIRPGSASSMPAPSYDPFGFVGDIVFMVAANSTSGYEVWSYDGNTAMLGKNIVAGTGSPTPQALKGIDDKLYFMADNLVNGAELWVWNPYADLTDTLTVFTCSDYTSPGGTVYSGDGTYTFEDVLPSINCPGCDSLIWVDLTIASSLISFDSIWACGEYTSPGGTYFDTEGTYDITDILPSIACTGVDSVLNIHLTIIDQITTTVFVFSGVAFVQQPGADYQWLDCDNGYAVIPGANDQDFLPTVDGNYACEITIGNCTDTTNCNFVVSTFGIGFEENTVYPILVYPNPFTELITIQSASNEIVTGIRIYNQQGQEVIKKDNDSTSISVNVNNLSSGIYLILILTETGQQTLKISKR